MSTKSQPTPPNATPTMPSDQRAAHGVALNALTTLLTQGGLPPTVLPHLRQAHQAMLDHMTTTTDDDDGTRKVPAGESIAAQQRRADGEDEEPSDDHQADDAPDNQRKGDEPNPLEVKKKLPGAKQWARTPTKDSDEPAPKKSPAPPPPQKPRARVSLVNGRPRFLSKGR